MSVCVREECLASIAAEWGSPEQAEAIGAGWTFATDGRVACPDHSIQKEMQRSTVGRCRHCGGRIGSIKLTTTEEIHHFGHVLTDAERGYCSQRCRTRDLAAE